MSKIRWSDEERLTLLAEVKRQYMMHPSMPSLDLLRMAQKKTLPAERQRRLTGNPQAEWVAHERQQWVKEANSYVPIKVSSKEAPKEPIPLKPDWKELLIELLSDAMVQVVAEAIVKARGNLTYLSLILGTLLTLRNPNLSRK